MKNFPEKKNDSFEEDEVTIIEPDTSILDDFIRNKKNPEKVHLLQEKEGSFESILGIKYSRYVVDPIVNFINNIIEENPDISKISEKQLENLQTDFDNLVSSLGSGNPVLNVLRKATKKRPYLPLVLDILGIATQKGIEFGKNKKK